MIYDIVPYLALAAGMKPVSVELALEVAEETALKTYPERNIRTWIKTLELFREKHPFELDELQRARETYEGTRSAQSFRTY